MAEHEIDAHYSNLPGPKQTRVLECSCGQRGSGPTWEDAGREMDEHLARVDLEREDVS